MNENLNLSDLTLDERLRLALSYRLPMHLAATDILLIYKYIKGDDSALAELEEKIETRKAEEEARILSLQQKHKISQMPDNTTSCGSC